MEYYEDVILYDIGFAIPSNTVTSIIGPARSGKSTLLRLFNRMNDDREGFWMSGDVLVNGRDIYDRTWAVEDLRREVGMVFEKPSIFQKSIFENVAFGLRLKGKIKDDVVGAKVEEALTRVRLWDEVKDKLHKSASSLSLGQQQQLCLARVLALGPSIILMDAPTTDLDPVSTFQMESLIVELKDTCTVVFSTQNPLQASRLSDYTAFLYKGELVEWDATNVFFTNPKKDLTQKYLTGRFG